MFDKAKILEEAKALQLDCQRSKDGTGPFIAFKEVYAAKYSYLFTEYRNLFDLVYEGHPHYDTLTVLEKMLDYAEQVNTKQDTMDNIEKTKAGVLLAEIFDPTNGTIAKNKEEL